LTERLGRRAPRASAKRQGLLFGRDYLIFRHIHHLRAGLNKCGTPHRVRPYWREVRLFRSWWAGLSRLLLILAVLAYASSGHGSHGIAAQIGGTDEPARGGWWLDYAEHATVLALAGLLAACRGPGWRILRALCSAVWSYLGLVATLVLWRHPGSWDRIGGAVAFLVGVGFGVAAWRGSEREVTGSPRRAPP
jgi:hypothetical protein